MSIWARINNRDFRVFGGDWNAQLDDADTFSFNVLLADVPDYRDLRYQSAAILYQGAVLVSGEITDYRLKRSSREQPIQVEFECTGELARLEGIKAVTASHYQNSAVLSILASILPSDWTIQQVNMADPLIATTIDLRNKEKLMQQLVAIFGNIPNLHFRYGGLAGNGDYTLEIGDFNTLTEAYTEGVNAVQISRDYTSHEVLRDITPYGYLSGEQVVTLSDLYSNPMPQTINASIAAQFTGHPDFAAFPVIPDGSDFLVRNLAVSIDRSTRKQFRLMKTKNSTVPTADQKAQAAYALWLSAVNLLKQSTLYEKFSIEAVLGRPPSIADKARLSGVVHEPVFNGNAIVEYVKTFEVDGDYRIVGFKTKFEIGELNGEEGIFFDVTCTDNDSAEEIDPELAIYRRLEQVGDFDDLAASVVLSPPLLASKTHTNADASDCVGPAAIAAKTFTVLSPTPPVGSTGVITSVATIPSTAVIHSETPPTNPGDPWIGCVSAAGGAAWPPAAGQSVSVLISFLFT